MNNDEIQIEDLLEYIPADCNYDYWLRVGMALKWEGYDVSVWDTWSMTADNYIGHDKLVDKWETFRSFPMGGCVTMGTIKMLAKEHGWRPQRNQHISSRSADKQGIDMFRRFINKMHSPEDEICIIRHAKYDEERGKWIPANGGVSTSVTELNRRLEDAETLADVIGGEYTAAAGCWMRVNPMTMFGNSDEDVAKYKYALIESDDMPKDEQKRIMLEELRLPCAALIDSAGKSIHAHVKVDAHNLDEFRERVRYLYKICANYGLILDENNKNPSRMSRLPGAERNGYIQRLIDMDVGCESWEDWISYIHKRETGLPRMKGLDELIHNPPVLAEPLINGVLRKGRKMLISGASKTGKSFSLIGLAYALAFGRKWMGFQCTQSKVLYINLEIADDSFDTRMLDVARALGIEPTELLSNGNLKWLDMRGINRSLESLSASIIDLCKDEDFGAIILDPIYKVSFANENDAQEMAKFCNAIDTICQQLNCAMIYCHHHSKGSQSGKSAIDRMSGSGVLARDPDAIVDLLELEYTPDAKKWLYEKHMRTTIEWYLDTYAKGWRETIPDEDELNDIKILEECTRYRLSNDIKGAMNRDIQQQQGALETITPIRFSASVREFPPLVPRNVYFMHPLHYADTDDIFEDAKPLDQAMTSKVEEKKSKMDRMKYLYMTGKIARDEEGFVTVDDMAEAMGISAKTVQRYLNESVELFEVVKGINRHQKSKFRLKNATF